MKIIAKIKKDGFFSTVNHLFKVAAAKINKLAFDIARRFPVKDNYIVFESSPDLSDNAYALYDYLRKNGRLDGYKVIWLVNHPENYKNTRSQIYLRKGWGKLEIRAYIAAAICKYYIFDHNCIITKKRDCQCVLYLSHGMAFKKTKGISNPAENFSYIVTHGNMASDITMNYYNVKPSMLLELGYPRNDYLFEKNDEVKNIFENEYHFSKYSKVILWMPTFRKSYSESISEDYINNSTGLPLFNTYEDLLDFNEFLKGENVLLILKLHHLQADMPVFSKKFSNLLILKDEDLQRLNVQLYQFIALTHALITDYSSVFVSYLLLDRPIIYTLDDYDEYNKSRGFSVDNMKQYLCGDHIYDIAQLKTAVANVVSGKDNYQEERRRTVNIFYNYPDNKSSQRIADFLNL